MPLSKTIDLRNYSEAGEYGVGLASRDEQGDYDHAFIVWYYSDPLGLRSTRRAAGFYPAGGDLYDLIIGGAPGTVMNDSKEHIAKQLVVLVNSDIFNSAIAIESHYANGTYRLGLNDCTTFVQRVAEVVPGLNVPDRLLNVYPSTYIDALFSSN